MADASRAEVCAVACAEAWRGDGEILASPTGTIPTLGARLARLTFEPDLVLSDGEATLLADTPPLGVTEGTPEGWLPFRAVFDVVAAGKRHVMMGASQLDRYGNQNISAIGDHTKPKVQLLGARGAPGNTVNHAVSYWVPDHSPRVFVGEVDAVTGVGYRRAAEGGAEAQRYHELRLVVTNLAVLDFATEDRAMRLASVHPGVEVDEVLAATGFDLVVEEPIATTRAPSGEELRLIREVLDPDDLRSREVPG